jgi:hypothetical protein
MPVFAGLFSGLFASIASFFALHVAKKTAYGLAAVAVFALLTAALMALIAASIETALAYSALPQGVVIGFAYFMPDNFPACVSALVAADVAVALYKWNVENLRLMAYVT